MPLPLKIYPFWCLGGDQPTQADASLFGFIVSILVSRWVDKLPMALNSVLLADPLNSVTVSRKPVRYLSAAMNYVERIHCRYFPDYEKWD